MVNMHLTDFPLSITTSPFFNFGSRLMFAVSLLLSLPLSLFLFILTVTTSSPTAPLSSVILSVTLYVPLAEYMCIIVGDLLLTVLPSPKSHVYLTILPSGS